MKRKIQTPHKTGRVSRARVRKAVRAVQGSYHVVTSMSGGWAVRRTGAERSTRVFERQEDAIAFGKALAKEKGGTLYIHGTDGRIRERISQ